ncbi:MAG: hypothetical protein HY561_08120 [Gemmatimonadetes bacterium]|nr:hypothetical protein [Gemmatimonadota bacterium]
MRARIVVLSAAWLLALPGWVAAQAQLEGTLSALNVRLTGAVVFLVPAEPTGAAEALRPPPTSHLIDQVNLRFVPRVLPVLPGSRVQFRNSDPILHNVFGPAGPGSGFDLGTYPRGERREHTFAEPGAHVILCHVHPEMVAYVLVIPTPYHSVVDRDGRFRLQLPAGRYALHVWHPRTRPYERPLLVRDGTSIRLEVELEAASDRRHAKSTRS